MSVIDYNEAWTQWGDMIKYSPAPFHRRRLILKLAVEISFDSVLDVGCGNAELLVALSQSKHVPRVVGADIAEDVLSRNRTAFPAFVFHQLDISAASLPEQFDLVVCSEVIEHVSDWQQALRHLREMTRGYLILTVPSRKVFPIDRKMGHHRHFASDELCQGLRQTGFEPERVWRWGFPFHTLYKHLINLSPETSMNRFSTAAYTTSDRVIAKFVAWLFYLNLYHLGTQLVVRARVA
jgi:SAM-dependent methyltransferase